MYGLFSSERIIKIKFDSENFIQKNVSSKIINQIAHNGGYNMGESLKRQER